MFYTCSYRERTLKYIALFCYQSLLFFCLAGSVNAQIEYAKKPDLMKYDKQQFDFCDQLGNLDKQYCYLNFGVDSTANTINNWFKHEGGDNYTPAKTTGRLRFGIEPRSGDLAEFDFRFKIRVKLPALKDRVELFFSDEEDDVNQQNVKAARSDGLDNRDQTVVALQFKKEDDDRMSYRIGFGRGSQLYTRARYSDSIKYSENGTLNYFSEVNYYSSDKLGFEVNADYQYLVDSRSAYEINNSFRFRDKSSTWFWRHEFRYGFTTKNDVNYLFTARVDGKNRPKYRKEQMLMSVRYKRKVLRDWLYIEVEPFVLWLRKEDFRPSIGLALRTEIHFST
jgi:hypothetical protein